MATSASFDGPASLRAEFVGSMPAAYALAFGSAEHAEHLDIVNRRQGRPLHIERWRALQNDTTIICLIADDRSGLLSLICEALVAVQLEIVSAQIYSRQHRLGRPTSS